ncbi:hypothetical protein C2S52_003378 [Perilla frutescens var. hirtella]|nr:hypothetical protein C2S52_003378 [Perilla frutescens var. hirtella]
MLIGLYGAISLATSPFCFASPVSAPDITECFPAEVPTNCCPPTTEKIINFQFPSQSAAKMHLVDGDYLAKFNKAVELMRALPDDDPRSFRQALTAATGMIKSGSPDSSIKSTTPGSSSPSTDIISTSSREFWDSPAGMQMPSIYTDPNSSLYDPLRNKAHLPPAIIDFNFNGTDSNTLDDQQIQTNLKIMHRQMVSNAKTPPLFFGTNPGAGSIETVPHNLIHFWTGDPTQPNKEDMGPFYSAGRDPIFYAHHSNIDRMWSVWKTLGGRRHDITDPDYLNASFVFYDENARLVRVKVRDCVDHTKLGYTYEDVEIPWLNSCPTPRVSSALRKLNVADAQIPGDVFPAKLDRVLKVVVKRPKLKRSKEEKAELEEILTHEKKIKTQLRVSITDILEELGAEEDEHVLVTLVPTSAGDALLVNDIKIELDD